MREINEYRGVRGLVVAEVTSDKNDTYSTGKWTELSGVQSVGFATSQSSETKFYDNIAALVANAEGADTISLVVSALENEIKALVEGTSYNAAKDMVVGTPKQVKYFALGFIGKKTNGVEEVNILYKGTFTGGDTTYNTENDGTDSANVTYTFTSIHTTTKIYTDGATKKPAKNVKFELSDTLTEADIFGEFTDGVSTLEALTPDEIVALS